MKEGRAGRPGALEICAAAHYMVKITWTANAPPMKKRRKYVGFQDVLRDTGNLHLIDELRPDKQVLSHIDELRGQSTEELRKIYLAWGTMTPMGLAAMSLLKERCPEEFFR